MQVAVAVDNFFPDKVSGSARVAWDVAQRLCADGHDVVVVCMSWPADRRPPQLAEEHGVRVLRCQRPVLPAWHPRRLEHSAQAIARTVAAHLGSEVFDLVHTHTPVPATGLRMALGQGPRYVATVHSPLLLEQAINWRGQGLLGRAKWLAGRRRLLNIERDVLCKSDAIHTLSRFTRQQLDRFHGIGDRVVVVPHWLRPELLRTHSRREARRLLGWPVATPTFFTVRRHVERMGLDTAIKAIGPLAVAGRCRLVLAGDGRLRHRLMRLARRIGASAEQVAFPGRLPEDQLHLAYEAADVFCLPTRALECFGLITIEAMSFGCPVLASDVGANPELLRPIMPEHLFPPGNVTALAQKAEAILRGTLRPPPSADIVAYVKKHFSSQTVWPRLRAVLEGASCDGGASRAAGDTTR